jgi:hypothetical protein|tara:strand:+ start:328 stop:543 length:216 start_codon:yes stop_codon:yes gene_type:complete
MKYHMIYPVNRWVTGEQLMDAASDAIVNNELTAEETGLTIPPVTFDDAIDILMDLGEVTITSETEYNPAQD